MTERYRCFEVEVDEKNIPTVDEINEKFAPWLDRKGDPCCVIEVYRDGNAAKVKSMLWTRTSLSLKQLDKILPFNKEVRTYDYVNMSEQISRLLCEDKANRIMALRRGF